MKHRYGPDLLQALEGARRTARLLSLCRWAMALDVPVALVFMVTWPLATGRLTFECDSLPMLGSTHSLADGGSALWFGAQWVLQSTAIACSFFCFAGLQVVHVTLALVAAAHFRTLAGLVQGAHDRRQLHRALGDHRRLLQVGLRRTRS